MMNNMINTLKKAIAFAVSMMITFTFVSITNTNAASDDYTALYEQMVEVVNEYRAESGLEPLQLDMTLCDMAEVRAEEITESFSHTRSNGSSSSTIFNDFDVEKGYSGENIAYYYKLSVTDVVEAWMDSEGHRENMLNTDYGYIGVGLYESDGYYYWTQVFSSNVQELNLTFTGEDTSYTLGDVNEDGKVDASDSSAVLSIYSQMSCGDEVDFTESQMKSADVNSDGKIDASDSSSILEYYSMLSMGENPEF